MEEKTKFVANQAFVDELNKRQQYLTSILEEIRQHNYGLAENMLNKMLLSNMTVKIIE